MYEIAARPVGVARFEPFQPVDMLYEFDGPRIFTVFDSEGELNLCCWSDEDSQVCRFIVVPTTITILDALRAGSISVFDALNQPRCWLCDLSPAWEVVSCVRVDFEAIPADSLPVRGTPLWPHLESRRFDLEGRIRELDKDHLSFELREIAGASTSQKFVFDAELLNDVSQAFGEDFRVKVEGRTYPVRNLAQAIALSRVS